MDAFSERYDYALRFAAHAHRNQLRKGSEIPYIAHPVHVSILLIRHGFSEEVAIAGLLHDVVEDCEVSLASIAESFGPQIASLVDAVSEQKSADGARLPWQERKEAKLQHLREGGPDIAALKVADTLHNARSIITDLQAQGPAVWSKFRGSPEQTLWYYDQVLAAAQTWLGSHPIVQELELAVAELRTRREQSDQEDSDRS